jgi:8-oxo-dGTP diphosphatase
MYTYSHPHPAVTVDVALFATRKDGEQILLIQRASAPFLGSWALPGGFVGVEEDLEPAARRELAEEAGITGIRLEQLGAFGAPNRDPRERVITVVFVGWVDGTPPPPHAGSDAAAARWHPLEHLPPLAFDHHEIIQYARARMPKLRR